MHPCTNCFIARMAVFTGLAALTVGGPAWGQAGGSGISNDRVSLPGGPGSLEGVGENIAINGNMGQMSHMVPINVPEGYAGMTPHVALSYSSGGGSSVVGMGWSLDFPYIERMTVKGLPRYVREDRFTADGSDQLVLISGTDPPTYRARYEKEFVRYTWRNAGDGKEGYWTAEHPDGKIAYYGADATGALVPSARVARTSGTFRYHLVDMMDRYGHKVHYDYMKVGDFTLAQHIGWAYAGEGGEALYEVTFEYASRSDKLSDCKPGFNELLEARLATINVFSRSQRIRQYQLSYEPYETSGGFSRLASVQMYGLGGKQYPAHETFEYSHTLGAACSPGDPCKKPYAAEMGSLGLDLGAGHTSLIDINGDSLPDVVDTSQPGAHRSWMNVLMADGTHKFVGPTTSAVGTKSSHDLGSVNVQVLDVNGDGFTDMLNRKTGQLLVNLGGGDWARVESVFSTCGDNCLPDLEGDFNLQDGELNTIRFTDYDNDKRIDVIKSMGSGASNVTMVYRNTASGFTRDDSVEALGAGFEDDRLELDDMNGDGLLDAIQVTQNSLRYRLSLGWGKWAPWVEITGFSFTDQEAVQADLEDLNGDGLADLVLVSGNDLRYWLNRNGASFDPERKIKTADLGRGVIPERTSAVKVLYADMNGNGSHDIVWVNSNGLVTYLELFPVRPNLLSRIKNGLGKVTDVTYRPSVEFQAEDGGRTGWKYPVPNPMNLVSQTDEWDDLTHVHQIVSFTYHDGFYDGAEKQFRGYSRVEEAQAADESNEEGKRLEVYDVGANDPYFFGLLLTRETQGQAGRSLHFLTNEYAECRLTGVPTTGLDFPVRNVCLKSETTELREGAAPSQWAKTRSEYTYDGYGNVTLQANLGVVAIGGGACAACSQSQYTGTPCGSGCVGDEQYTSFQYAQPESNGDRWLLHSVVRARTYGVAATDGSPANSNYAETLTYYDGPAFEGLALGLVDRGGVTRVVQRANALGDVVTPVRNKLDAHGNVVETLDALGAPGGDEHRRAFAFDDAGLKIVRGEIMLKDAVGVYSLRQDIQYDPTWDEIIESSAWQLVRGGSTKDARNSTYYTYDEFGRLISRTFPGEASGFTSEEYTYDLGSPKSRVIAQMRSKAGGAFDLVKVVCRDGHGRQYQQRQRISADGDTYQVDGFTVFDTRGNRQKVFLPYLGTGSDCDAAPPEGTKSTWTNFDAMGRATKQILPATDQDGSDAPFTRTVYLPLATVEYDTEDNSATSPHANTPTTMRHNGRGQRIAEERLLTAGGAPLLYTYHYDELGNLGGVIDPAGHRHTEDWDLLGRVVKVDDPNRGTLALTYDDAGNRVSETDSRAVTRRSAFDGANRLLARWKDGDEAATRVSYAYDAAKICPSCTNTAGRLAAISYPLSIQGAGDSAGSETYHYDLRGNAISAVRTLDGKAFAFGWTHDNAGRVVTRTFADGRVLTYSYDGLSRLIAVGGVIERIDFTPQGDLSVIHRHNGATTTYGYDARRRLSSISVGVGSKMQQSLAYSRDREGNVTAVDDLAPVAGRPSFAARLRYDAAYRLTQAQLSPDTSAAEDLDFAYDGIDNVTSLTSSRGVESRGHVGAYAYQADRPNAAVTAGALAMTYDAAGNMLTRGDESFTWDDLGRMTSASKAGAVTSRNAYGPQQQRVVRLEGDSVTFYPDRDFEVRDGVSAAFVRVGNMRVARLESDALARTLLSDLAPASDSGGALTSVPDGRIDAGDAWLAHAASQGLVTLSTSHPPSEPGRLLWASVGRLLLEKRGEVVHLHHDHLQSVILATDQSGAELGRRAYYPQGQIRGEDDGGAGAYGFGDQERDGDTGLVHFDHRYLDPGTMRWMSADPAFGVLAGSKLGNVAEATCTYAYVGNNVFTSIDPTGLVGVKPYKFSTKAGLAIKVAMKEHALKKQKFASKDDAAVAFAEAMNPLSIKYKRETGGFISERADEKGNKYYKLHGFVSGSTAGLTFGNGKPSDVANIHTHGNYSPHHADEEFSRRDIAFYKNRNQDGYLATPRGYLKFYDRDNGVQRDIRQNIAHDAHFD